MDLDDAGIEREFKRQVRLCSGIGPKLMHKAIDEHFSGPKGFTATCGRCEKRVSISTLDRECWHTHGKDEP